jgi:hypothetical protein
LSQSSGVIAEFYRSNGCKDKNIFAKLYAFAVKSNKTSRKKELEAAPTSSASASRPCVSYIILLGAMLLSLPMLLSLNQ